MNETHAKSAKKSSSLLRGVYAKCGVVSVGREFHKIEATSVRDSHRYMMKATRPCESAPVCSRIMILWGVRFSLELSTSTRRSRFPFMYEGPQKLLVKGKPPLGRQTSRSPKRRSSTRFTTEIAPPALFQPQPALDFSPEASKLIPTSRQWR
jgi:hypothetical protein